MSTLPGFPTSPGFYPGQSDIAIASQQKALVLIVGLLLLFTDVLADCGNETFEFFLQVIVLLVGGVFCSANR